jgi:hypothetical protein
LSLFQQPRLSRFIIVVTENFGHNVPLYIHRCPSKPDSSPLA